ncbi:hypothetical protein N3K66_000458 [Trichothecium roseum]|uniref:Uncharacterized protein n=1 Tax=Trichothecium roseum TaxID=47278 RepID=A0ACC0VCK0_9HYPO|nr:hypothetical protein N3K66_000458 [Trichothecium roseum]
MLKKSVEAKVRPLSNTSLDKASLVGAARVYVSKDTLLSLTGALNNGKLCVVERVDAADAPAHNADPSSSSSSPTTTIRREASLWILPEKNLNQNVVMMTRAFQDAAGFKIGDQVRISLVDNPPAAPPTLVEVLAEDVTDEKDKDEKPSLHRPSWDYALSLSLDRAELIFPGMVFDGVAINKVRRSFKILSVNSRNDSLASFKLESSLVRIKGQPTTSDEASRGALDAPATVGPEGGELVIGPIPGMAKQVERVNYFLSGFHGSFWVSGEYTSCGLVIHGGPGTGKTHFLERIAATGWGDVHWIQPSDKLTTVREAFAQAVARQPSMVLIDGLDQLIPADRSNRDAVIEVISKELDALSRTALAQDALPKVVVIATCADYLTDIPTGLCRATRFGDAVALPIPRLSERLEILRSLDPPIQPEDKEAALLDAASRTHAHNPEDLTKLVLKAKTAMAMRLRRAGVPRNRTAAEKTENPQYVIREDMNEALAATRPTAMRDINLNPPTIRWQDVGGQEDLKKVLSQMIKHTKGDDARSRSILRQPPKGLLLYGPPGCSKTLSAQAMATESGFNFFAVKGAELLNMYVGESERAVRTLFERARQASPSIIFFDEIDSIGGQRSGDAGGGSSSSRSTGAVNTVTALLTEMDGFETLTGVLVLAATNRPEQIDPALLRPGRFDQVVYVGPPDLAAREAIFGVHLRGLSLADDVDVRRLAELADGHSGAEIKAIVNEAGLAVMDRDNDDDDGAAEGVLKLSMADLEAAMGRTMKNITPFMTSAYENWRRQFRK